MFSVTILGVDFFWLAVAGALGCGLGLARLRVLY